MEPQHRNLIGAASFGLALVALQQHFKSRKSVAGCEEGGSGVERRAAIDVGSGSTKMVVADVDVKHFRIVHEVYSVERPISFSLESKAHPEGMLSERTMEAGLATLKAFVAEAQRLGCDNGAVAAVATEVFRKAPNGRQFLDRVWKEVGIDVRLVSQAAEAELGFRTAFAHTAAEEETGSNNNNNNNSLHGLTCWDCGGGSFQIVRCCKSTTTNSTGTGTTTSSLSFLPPYLAPLGSGVVCAQALEMFGNGSSSSRSSSSTNTTSTNTTSTNTATTSMGDSLPPHHKPSHHHHKPSPHPLTRAQFYELVHHLEGQLPQPPDWLLANQPSEEVANHGMVVTAIGGENSMFRLIPGILEGNNDNNNSGAKRRPQKQEKEDEEKQAGQDEEEEEDEDGDDEGSLEVFGVAEVEAAASLVFDKDDAALTAEFGPSRIGTETHLVVSKLALLLATMRHCGIGGGIGGGGGENTGSRHTSSSGISSISSSSSSISSSSSSSAGGGGGGGIDNDGTGGGRNGNGFIGSGASSTQRPQQLQVRYQPCVGSCAGILTHPGFTTRKSAFLLGL